MSRTADRQSNRAERDLLTFGTEAQHLATPQMGPSVVPRRITQACASFTCAGLRSRAARSYRTDVVDPEAFRSTGDTLGATRGRTTRTREPFCAAQVRA